VERTRVARSQKKWIGEGRTILFVDESGFYLLPCVVRSWSAVGRRPVLREWLSRDHLSAIAGISEDGQLYILEQEWAFDGEDIVGFLKYVGSQIKGLIGIVWDAASIHRGEKVREFLAEGGAKRIELMMLPAYSPDLNPVEGVWSYIKGVLLANIVCHNLAQLRQVLTEGIRRLQSRPDVVQSCFRQPGCY